MCAARDEFRFSCSSIKYVNMFYCFNNACGRPRKLRGRVLPAEERERVYVVCLIEFVLTPALQLFRVANDNGANDQAVFVE